MAGALAAPAAAAPRAARAVAPERRRRRSRARPRTLRGRASGDRAGTPRRPRARLPPAARAGIDPRRSGASVPVSASAGTRPGAEAGVAFALPPLGKSFCSLGRATVTVDAGGAWRDAWGNCRGAAGGAADAAGAESATRRAEEAAGRVDGGAGAVAARAGWRAAGCGSAWRVTVPSMLKFWSSGGPIESAAGVLVPAWPESCASAGTGANASAAAANPKPKRKPALIRSRSHVNRAKFARRIRHMPIKRSLFKHSVDEPPRNPAPGRAQRASTSTSSLSSSA